MKYKIIYGYYNDPITKIVEAEDDEEVIQMLEGLNGEIADELQWNFIDADYEYTEDENEQEQMEEAAWQEAYGQCEAIWVKMQ